MKLSVLIILGVLASLQSCSGQEDKKDTLKIVSILAPPFLMKKDTPKDGQPLVGNDAYKGFIMDLVKELGKITGFEYEIQLVKDGRYGVMNKDGTWNGMIGEVTRKDVDAAIAPITITSMRERVVDFSKPFMSSGITMIAKKTQVPFEEAFGGSMCLILQPFRASVWIIIIVAFVITGVIVGLIERVSTKSKDPVLRNIGQGCWWTVQSMALQGFFRGPRSTGSKVVLAFWFGFSIITFSMYISSMSNFLTAEGNFIQNHAEGIKPDFISKQSNIRSASDLAAQKKVSFGTIKDGATYSFFRTSKIAIYERIYQKLTSSDDNLMVSGIDEGIKKVKESDGDFVFFSDSAYANYHVARDCELMKIGGNLNSVGYGIATPKDSRIRDSVSLAILEMQEIGKLQALYNKWWDGEGCSADGAHVVVAQDRDLLVGRKIDMKQFAGVAVLLLIGLLLGGVFAVLELFKKKKSNTEAEGTALNSGEEKA